VSAKIGGANNVVNNSSLCSDTGEERMARQAYLTRTTAKKWQVIKIIGVVGLYVGLAVISAAWEMPKGGELNVVSLLACWTTAGSLGVMAFAKLGAWWFTVERIRSIDTKLPRREQSRAPSALIALLRADRHTNRMRRESR
jgi:hypothetical protein